MLAIKYACLNIKRRYACTYSSNICLSCFIVSLVHLLVYIVRKMFTTSLRFSFQPRTTDIASGFDPLIVQLI